MMNRKERQRQGQQQILRFAKDDNKEMQWQEQTNATAKCGGLSTARRTMKLSAASFEMTAFQ
jgi:hypothetical protein